MTKGLYTKAGVTSRLESTQQMRSVVTIRESGSARFEGPAFVATAREAVSGEEGENLAATHAVEQFAARFEDLIRLPLVVDRLVVVAGAASHTYEAAGGAVAWKESNARCFASVAAPDTSLQVHFELGSTTLESIGLPGVQLAIDAMRVFRGGMAPPPSLRLARHVAAEFWPALAANRAASTVAQLFQSAHPEFVLDGTGSPIERCDGPSWPNVYRPSYRVPPVPTPFHLDVETNEDGGASEFTAVALLQPLRIERGCLTAVMLARNDGSSFRVALSLTPDEWLSAIVSRSPEATWFPFGAGSWGRDVTLRLGK